MKMTLLKRGLLLMSVPFIFQFLFIGGARLGGINGQRTQRLNTQIKQVVDQLRRVKNSITDSETDFFRYLLTAEPSYLEHRAPIAEKIPEALAQFETLVAQDEILGEQTPALKDRSLEVKRLSIELLAQQQAAMKKRRAESSPADIKKYVDEERAAMDKLQESIESFFTEFQQAGIAHDQFLRSSVQWVIWLYFAGTIGSLLYTLVAGILMSRGIRSRLNVLCENTERFAKGQDLLPTKYKKDEINQLDIAFRDMAKALGQSQSALRDQTQLLRSILDNMGDGILVADLQGRILLSNPASIRLLPSDQTESEVLERAAKNLQTDEEISGIFLSDQETPFAPADFPIQRAIRGEEFDSLEVHVRRRKQAEGVWLSVTGRPLRSSDGKIYGGVIVIRDVTERKKGESVIRRVNEELERRVQERTQELTAANADLEQKSQENELFIYSVSHDLRSPLVNLQGFSNELTLVCKDLRLILVKELPPKPMEDALQIIDGDISQFTMYISAAVARLSNIIDALLRLSRAGRVSLTSEFVDLAPIAVRIVDSLQSTIQGKGATVTVSALPKIVGDATAVEQILANLLGNALNYLDPKRKGEIEVGVEKQEGQDSNGFTTVFVKDNGLGIAEEYRHKIFQPFQRLHSDRAKGEGMGLALIRRYADRLGGSIRFESSVGVGTTLFVTFPNEKTNEADD